MAQMDDFQARLSRIGAEQSNQPAGLVQPTRKPTQEVNLNGSMLENAKYPASIAGAFVLGLLAVFFSRFVRFHLLGLADPESDIFLATVADGGMALAVGFCLRQMFKLEGAEWISAQAAGVTVMVAAMHNLVHIWPDTFALIFDPEWTAFVLDTTEFRTMRIMEYILPF
ncbi:hypothetical protein [Litoreibacter arenae]|uniref:Uncharacterized protein n=1 Tax=Litoreibacter arenae DSM 19593 TaxID=1123360 RepID=S9QGU8_9RHOB|nr:hypothetical protein [Litoreibacter arenae]EPX79067.1 hypothetical protein thalar_01885 [Litoreibacter arenae DSM 19593]